MPQIDARTKVCAVFGHPVGHSLSPEMHNAAFEALGLPFVYVAHEVPPGQVATALAGVRAMGYRGLSITIPHKVTALEAVDAVDDTARIIGCINTVVNDDGRLFGTNSDGLGALNALREAGADPRGRSVLVLGSGGAARAIAVTLARESPPATIRLLGIDAEERERLAADVRSKGQSSVLSGELTEETLGQATAEADILLHCSPIGMKPNSDRSLVPPHLLHRGLTVFDAVYNPRNTRLLQDAAGAGCRTIPGLEMFLGQAYVQFELWTARPAPRDVMRRVVEAKL